MNDRNELKIGFIGAGKHAKANIYASLRLLDVPIQSISTQHLDSAQATAEKYVAKSAYDNYKTMLEKENLDVVFIITDSTSQATITKDCLNADVHVFVEKALGMNEAEAAEIAEISAKTGKHVMVGFMKRFAPSYRILQENMNNQAEFGRVLSFKRDVRNHFWPTRLG